MAELYFFFFAYILIGGLIVTGTFWLLKKVNRWRREYIKGERKGTDYFVFVCWVTFFTSLIAGFWGVMVGYVYTLSFHPWILGLKDSEVPSKFSLPCTLLGLGMFFISLLVLLWWLVILPLQKKRRNST